MDRFVITERLDGATIVAPLPTVAVETKSAIVEPYKSGAVYKIGRLLGVTSNVALIVGTNANLKLDTGSGVISASAGIGGGVSQKALVRESLGDLALEYPVTITGAMGRYPANALTLSGRLLTIADAIMTFGGN